MLAVGGTRDYAGPIAKEHSDDYPYDICPGCGEEKRTTSDLCQDCTTALRAEMARREKMKATVRHAMATLLELCRHGKDEDEMPKVKIEIIAPFNCDLPETMREVVREVMK